MKFSKLSEYLEKLEKTSSRIEITKLLADLFKTSGYEEIGKVSYLILGNLAGRHEAIVFNIAERMMIQAIAKAYNKPSDEVKKLYKDKGDLGEVATILAERSKIEKVVTKPTVLEVYIKLLQIAEDDGEKSVERKIGEMAQLFSSLDPLSVKYVARIPLGKLRLGFSDKTILDALSWMEAGDKSKKIHLERAYQVVPDVGMLSADVKKFGIEKAVKNVKPIIGMPVLPMLAQRLKSPKDMIDKMKEVAVEPKFDGLRIQLHFKRKGFEEKNKKFKAYTRNLNENSWMFPELDGIEGSIKGSEVILDTEAIGVDEARKSLANFQTTMTRRRKHDIKNIASKVTIKFYVFDVLYKDGKSLINEPYLERRKILEETVVEGDVLEVVDYVITKDPDKISELMGEKLSEGLEGIMVKRVDGKYIAGRTGWRWVKMKEKESSVAKLSDTIDCIVMGYYAGRGKRSQFGMGGFLVGIYDNEKIKTFSKIGTGITDEQFRELKKRLSDLEIKEKPKEYEVNKMLIPDVWVEASLVVEIAADEITKSPIHSSGYALRFPRLVKFRDDKDLSQATTLTEIISLSRIK